jgi:hypothetical protein
LKEKDIEQNMAEHKNVDSWQSEAHVNNLHQTNLQATEIMLTLSSKGALKNYVQDRT